MAVHCKLILHFDDSIIKVPKVIETKLAIELNSINNWFIEDKFLLHPQTLKM